MSELEAIRFWGFLLLGHIWIAADHIKPGAVPKTFGAIAICIAAVVGCTAKGG
jgi:hypothetical protein